MNQPAPVRADEAGLWAAVPVGETLDVLIQGRRVFSVVADPPVTGSEAFLPWPTALVKYLDGRADVEVCSYATGQTLARGTIVTGSGEGSISLIDEHGRPVAIHKWGKLNQTFDDIDDAARQSYLDQVERVLAILAADCGLPAFISFGTLLGAVRNGRLIGHDVDVDLGYLSRHETPVDAIRESFTVERALRERTGWRITRANGGFLQLFPEQVDGSTRNIDVFTCFGTAAGRLYQVNDIGTDGGRSAIEPLQQIELEGRKLPAPAQPEVLLEAAYGPTWQIPDPTFMYQANPTRRRIRMWVGGLREDRDRWSRFYRDHLDEVPSDPSPFSTWVSEHLDDDSVVEVGCGNGRDVMAFARAGRPATGLDVVPGAFRAQRRIARRDRLPATFRYCNLSSLRETLTLGADLSPQGGRPAVVARLLLHGLDVPTRENFWRLCRMLLNGGGRCFVEFRVPDDVARPKHFTWEKGQRSLDPDVAEAEATRHGGVVRQRLVGEGFAPFHAEEPILCRLVVEWPAALDGRNEREGVHEPDQ